MNNNSFQMEGRNNVKIIIQSSILLFIVIFAIIIVYFDFKGLENPSIIAYVAIVGIGIYQSIYVGKIITKRIIYIDKDGIRFSKNHKKYSINKADISEIIFGGLSTFIGPGGFLWGGDGVYIFDKSGSVIVLSEQSLGKNNFNKIKKYLVKYVKHFEISNQTFKGQWSKKWEKWLKKYGLIKFDEAKKNKNLYY